MSTPNPMILAKLAEQKLAAHLEPDVKGKVDRPRTHDGVLKTKQLKQGMVVRAYLHGKPCGSEKVVAQATAIDDGAFWEIEFSSAHVNEIRPAAYRWYCEALDGKPLDRPQRPKQHKPQGPRQPRAPRRTEHLTTNLGDVLAEAQRVAASR